jgi:hypothetical protein
MADVSGGITATGLYRNEALQQFEAWAHNRRTGESVRLSWYGYYGAQTFPAAFQEWEREVWRKFLVRAMADA